MAIVSIRIGGADAIFSYDDGDFDSSFESTAPIKAGAPVDPNDVVILSGLPALANVVSAAANITNHAVVRGDGGAKGVQDSLVIISDTGGVTIPNGLTIGSVGAPNIIQLNATTIRIGDGGATDYTQFAVDGELTLAGTARVLDVIDVEPDAVRRPVANPPGESLEDGFPTHDYDDTTDESVFKHVELTHGYANAGTIHVHLDYFVDVGPADGTVDDLSWGLEYKKISIGDVFDFTAGSTTIYAADLVTQGNNKKTHQSSALSLTTAGFVAGDIILMRMFRDASGTGNTDNVSGDVRVFDYHIEFLVDKLGEAT